MCFHSQQTQTAMALSKRFKVSVPEGANISSEAYNGFAHPYTPVITSEHPKVLQLYQWGLIPFWAKDRSFQKNTLTAMIETLHEKPSFKGNIRNRCLVVVDGFFEWQWLDPAGKKKKKFQIGLPDGQPFAMAGLFGFWTDPVTGALVETYTVVTTVANELMATIHNNKKRMPVTLTPDLEEDWLKGGEVRNFAKPDIELLAKEIG
jgi:putative SOS response-associated peptidase YedK